MMILPQNTLEYVSSVIEHAVNEKYGLQFNCMSVYANHSFVANYKIRLEILSYFNLSRYLKIEHKEEHNIYYFDFEVGIQFSSSVSEQIAESAINKVLWPLFEALEEFSFDKEVDKLLTN